MKRRKVVGLLTFGLLISGCAMTAPSSTQGANPAFKSRFLTLSDMPNGWTKNSFKSDTPGGSLTSCISPMNELPTVGVHEKVAFSSKNSIPAIGEGLAEGTAAQSWFTSGIKMLDGCHSISSTSNGKTIHGSVKQFTVPKLGEGSYGYEVTIPVGTTKLFIDAMFFRVTPVEGYVAYITDKTADLKGAISTLRKAVAKASGKS